MINHSCSLRWIHYSKQIVTVARMGQSRGFVSSVLQTALEEEAWVQKFSYTRLGAE